MPRFTFEDKAVHYRDVGRGRPLVLLPGNTASSAVHGAEIRYFRTWFRIICPDYPGYGKSERLATLPADFWRANAETIAALLEHLDLRDCVVMGTSGGASIAMHLAGIAAERVGCVIADSFPGDGLSVEAAREIIAARDLEDSGAQGFWRSAHGEDWREVVGADSAMLLAAAEAGTAGLGDGIGRIDCPVLFTASLADEAIPSIERGLAAAARQLPNAKIVLFPQGRHPLMWSQAGAFRREAMRFIQDAAAGAGRTCRETPEAVCRPANA